jgi:shikimate dehydrogenase
MDIVYNPLNTRLLQDAQAAGCRTIQGINMFLYQAVAQFELWTGKPAPIQVMRNVLTSHFS